MREGTEDACTEGSDSPCRPPAAGHPRRDVRGSPAHLMARDTQRNVASPDRATLPSLLFLPQRNILERKALPGAHSEGQPEAPPGVGMHSHLGNPKC